MCIIKNKEVMYQSIRNMYCVEVIALSITNVYYTEMIELSIRNTDCKG